MSITQMNRDIYNRKKKKRLLAVSNGNYALFRADSSELSDPVFHFLGAIFKPLQVGDKW